MLASGARPAVLGHIHGLGKAGAPFQVWRAQNQDPESFHKMYLLTSQPISPSVTLGDLSRVLWGDGQFPGKVILIPSDGL